jgi:CRISPR-associated protein Csm4
MKLCRYTLTPKTPFGSPLVGDSLFGHLCWAVRNGAGEAKLTDLLEGYLDGKPFAVVSDAVPSGFIPRPTVPMHFFKREENPSRRKELKRKRWLPVAVMEKPFEDWLEDARDSSKIIDRVQAHNTINRLTGTTGTGQFAPYTVEQFWHPDEAVYDLYICVDENRLSVAELSDLLGAMGASGFGKDASIGLGKFEVSEVSEPGMPEMSQANAYLTLACCAPQGLEFVAEESFYEVTNRFGRHGDVAALMGVPYKNPILMASRGAVMAPQAYEARLFIGQGIGGGGELSASLPSTVHQGYAPVIPIAARMHSGGQP